MENRRYDYDILPEIQKRWSPRAFSPEKVPLEDILAVLEAARYAPSCYNEQPWRFIVAREDSELEKMGDVLASSNYVWAVNAPVLIMVTAKRLFKLNGEENYWHMFDTGTAWGYLSLEAQKRGYETHAMGGFNQDKAREVYNIPDDIDIICVVAMGKYGDKAGLPDKLQQAEAPSPRREIADILLQPIYNED